MAEPRIDISIVLPSYNEARNIEPMCAALKQVIALHGRCEVIFVNDGSTDETLEEIRKVAALDPIVRYVSFTRNFGHQAALRAGLRYARGRAVVLMDADFEHPPELIGALVDAWHAGAQIVATSRSDHNTGLSILRRATSRFYYKILNAIGDTPIERGSADFMLLDRTVVDVIDRIDDPNIFLRGLVRWLGFRLVTIGYQRGARRYGNSKYELSRMLELAITGIAAHSIRPLRFAIWLALFFAVVGFVFFIYSILAFLLNDTVVGWTSIMGAIAILGATQLLVLGVVGEYIGRILRATSNRPTYVVAETETDETGAVPAPPPQDRSAQLGQLRVRS
jgi:dolichol-phosphate mannosyltransferase